MFARQQQALAAVVGGQAQGLLLNYEEELTSQFGSHLPLATRLRFPVFIGSFTSEGEQSLRRLRKSLPPALRTFIADYEAGIARQSQLIRATSFAAGCFRSSPRRILMRSLCNTPVMTT